jgi:hypothetical protein
MRAAWYSKNGDARDVLVVGELVIGASSAVGHYVAQVAVIRARR